MSDFEDVKPYTQAELDQQAIWANEFDQWWESEGQYQRAGGGQYERSFAWWAWLNQEQKQQAIIDNLKAQINNMEACYIEKKKELEDQLNQTKGACGRYDRLYEEYRLLELLVGNYRVLAQEVLPRCSRELLENIEGWEKALRGGHE